VNPSVTVVIPCYNQGHFLRTAIDSAVRQTYGEVEILVVDDGSTDDTAKVARSYGPQVTLIQQPNAGLSAARNKAILRGAGQYIQLLDADDALHPQAIADKVALAESRPDAAAVRGGWCEMDVFGTVLATVAAPDLGADPFHALFDPLRVGPPCTYLARRSALLDAGLFDPNLTSCEDWDMWLRLALDGGALITAPTTVASYRNHGGSMSKDYSRMWRSGSQVLRRARLRHDCAACSTAFRDGIQRWRRYCYLTCLRDDIRTSIRSLRIAEATGKAVAAVIEDPAVAKLIGASIARNLSGAAS
jgi:glycosyltransferase involved in cell wall biosynthesis